MSDASISIKLNASPGISTNKELKRKAITGVGWVAVTNYCRLFLQFIIKVVLARLLLPEHFGVVAIAYIMINGLKVFNNFGFGAALIHRSKDVAKATNTAFLLLPLVGLMLSLAAYFSGPVMASIFNNESVSPVVQALSLIFVLSSLGAIPESLLEKELDYHKKFTIEILPAAVGGIVAIIMAFKGYGVWSLVVSQIITYVIRVPTAWLLCSFRPSLQFDFKIFKELVQYSKYVIGLAVVMYLYNNLDNFSVGKILGASALGFYSVAYYLSNLANENVVSFFNRVSFPVYTKLRDVEKIKMTHLKVVRYSSLFAIPMMCGMYVLAPELIRIIYGEKWIAAAAPLQILCLFGVFRSIDATTGHVYWGIGKPKLSQNVGIANLVVMALIIYPLTLKFGLPGTATAITVAKAITLCINYTVWKKVVHGKIIEVLQLLVFPILASVIMVLVLWLMKKYLYNNILWYHLIILISSGMAVYFAQVFLFQKKYFEELKGLLGNFR